MFFSSFIISCLLKASTLSILSLPLCFPINDVWFTVTGGSYSYSSLSYFNFLKVSSFSLILFLPGVFGVKLWLNLGYCSSLMLNFCSSMLLKSTRFMSSYSLVIASSSEGGDDFLTSSTTFSSSSSILTFFLPSDFFDELDLLISVLTGAFGISVFTSALTFDLLLLLLLALTGGACSTAF